MSKMPETVKEYLIKLINNEEQIPEEFKYLLFPSTQEEYELTYAGKMRKEDIFSGEDGTLPVPLQVDRVFNGDDHGSPEEWKNMIVFGDNLQFLKTIKENTDPMIKNKVKGKVQMIYIDPPFATQDEFQNKVGAKAYSDKKKGSEFIEYIRRRLLLAKDVLADDGTIFVHLDQKMGHYIKVVLDEVFGKNNFVNEIIWNYGTYIGQTKKNFPRKHDNIYVYKKRDKNKFNMLRDNDLESDANYKRWKKYFNVNNQICGDYYPSNDSKFDGYVAKFIQTYGRKPQKKDDVILEIGGKVIDDVWYIQSVNPVAKEKVHYPTQKPEELLERIIKSSTDQGDLVLDFFGGSGTTMAVAEKLGRRWIICDLGKLAYFTMQKRMLSIQNSKSLELNNNRLTNMKATSVYGKPANPFITCKLGLYDLGKTLSLEWENYKKFVSQLFEFECKDYQISGISFDGEKKGFPVKIFDYIKYENSAVDYQYLSNIHKTFKSKNYSRIYIVAPATRINFIADYELIDETRYYFLKVPYQMIEELHKTPFMKSRQPRSKDDINNIDEMKGFQFIYAPEVECELIEKGENNVLRVSKFLSDTLNGGVTDNFSTLSSIFANFSYNDSAFMMDDFRFWNEIESDKKENNDTKIIKKGGKISSMEWTIPSKLLGDKSVFIFTDIYGNDVTVLLEKEK